MVTVHLKMKERSLTAMSENENKVVSLTIDAKYGKIRIHKNTLSFLGRPEYISLIINPEDHTLGVKGSKVGDGESHYVNRKLFETKQCCELNSIGLTRAISEICPELAENKRIRINGKLIPGEHMAVFSLLRTEDDANGV